MSNIFFNGTFTFGLLAFRAYLKRDINKNPEWSFFSERVTYVILCED